MMKKILFPILLASAVVLSCSASRNYTMVQYNVGRFQKFEDSMEPVSKMMKKVKADVISLNELDSSVVSSNHVFQLKQFASMMGSWNYSWGKAKNYKDGTYGIGIASSPEHNVLSSAHFVLDKGEGKETRAFVVNEYEDFIFISTHIEVSHVPTRMMQVKVVDDYVREHYADSQKPVFLLGDFNSRPESVVMSYMRENWTIISPEDAFTLPHHRKSPRCVDYVLLFNNPGAAKVKVLSAYVPDKLKGGDIEKASDHRPVIVKVRIEK